MKTTTEKLAAIRASCVKCLEFYPEYEDSARAAFKSTIAAIDGLLLMTDDIYGGHLCDNYGRGCGACQEAERIQSAIISAWDGLV